MFFHMIPLYSRIMFIGITVLECFLAIMLLRWDAWKRYPVMSAYLTWQAVGGAACLLIACFGAAMPYFYAYYAVTILLNLIAFAVALELYYKIFDPRIGLFAWGRRHVVIIISVSVAMAIMLGTSVRGKKWRLPDQNDDDHERGYERGIVGHLLRSMDLFAISGIHLAPASRRNCHGVHSLSYRFSYLYFHLGTVLS